MVDPAGTRSGGPVTKIRATGAMGAGALVLGAFAMGAVSVTALTVGALAIGRARLERVEIGRLTVGHLDLGPSEPAPGTLTAVTRIRSAAGLGDALARLLADHVVVARTIERGILHRAHRSISDPDLFVLYEQFPDDAAFERCGHAARLDALRRRVAEQGIASDAAESAVELEVCRTI